MIINSGLKREGSAVLLDIQYEMILRLIISITVHPLPVNSPILPYLQCAHEEAGQSLRWLLFLTYIQKLNTVYIWYFRKS